jgi:CubicO group peptidase (beta-lactamase class C family)
MTYSIDHPAGPIRRLYLCALLTLLSSAVTASDAISRIMATAEENYSTGVVIMHKGKIIAKQYWRLDASSDPRLQRAARTRFFGTTDDGLTLEDVASVQKSVVAVLAGIAQEKGLIDFDKSVSSYLGDKWANGEPSVISRITIRHLMSQTSGLDEKLMPEAPPGTKWRYNTTAYQNVLRVLEAASGLDKNVLTKAWLTNALGMQDTYWVDRASRNSKGPPLRGLVTHARDLAHFGQFVLDNGQVNGQRLMKEETLAELLQPSSTMNPS